MASVAKDVVVSLGMISCTVRVESAQYTVDALTNVCDAGHEPVAVTRPLICGTCGPINIANTKKAKKESGGLVILDESELVELASNDAQFRGRVQLIPYDREQVELNTGTGEKLYQLHAQTAPENYALLVALVAQYPDKVFVARYAVRTKAQLYTLSAKGSCLFLTERNFTSNLKPVPTFDVSANESFIPLAVQMVEQMQEPFSAEKFADQYQEHLTALTRSRPVVGGKTVLSAPVSKRVSDELLAAALLEYRSKVSS